MTVKTYLLSLPERFARSGLGLGAGIAREVGEVVLPAGVRRTQLYQNVVDAMLRFLIEQVGGAEGVYASDGTLPDDFLVRRTAGNAVEVLGIVAFRASPVWVLAALADLCGTGRHLIPEIAAALKADGLLDQDTEFTSVDQLLDGLERTSSRLAATINAPPLDVHSLRREWNVLREDAKALGPRALPSRDVVTALWSQLRTESIRQQRTVFETSSMMAVSAIRSLPDALRWLSASTRTGTARSGQVLASALLDHYRLTLDDIQRVGYVAYARQHLRPYVRAAFTQFSPRRPTLTERALARYEEFRTRRTSREG